MKTRFFVTDSMGLSLTTFNATDLGKITQNNGHYAVQGHSRSPILVPIESPCATYTNLHHIYRFLVIADYRSNLRFRRGYLSLTHLFGVNT